MVYHIDMPSKAHLFHILSNKKSKAFAFSEIGKDAFFTLEPCLKVKKKASSRISEAKFLLKLCVGCL